MSQLTLVQVAEYLHQYKDLVQAAQRARQETSSFDSFRDKLADLADQQANIVGCALQSIDSEDPELRIPELEQELLDEQAEHGELTELHEAMLERSPQAKAQAINAVRSAMRQRKLLSRGQQQFQAEQVEAEARVAAARVAEAAINNVIAQAAKQEAARKEADMTKLAADAATAIEAKAVNRMQALLRRSAELDAERSVLDHAVLTELVFHARQLKAQRLTTLPTAALAAITQVKKVDLGSNYSTLEVGGSDPLSSRPALAAAFDEDGDRYEVLKAEEREVVRQLRYRLCQLKVVEADLRSRVDAGL